MNVSTYAAYLPYIIEQISKQKVPSHQNTMDSSIFNPMARNIFLSQSPNGKTPQPWPYKSHNIYTPSNQRLFN